MDKVTLADFIARWQEKISKIEKSSMDDDAVRGIKTDFQINKMEIKMCVTQEDLQSGFIEKLDTLESELDTALETANCRFKSQNFGETFDRTDNAFNGMFEEVHQ